MSWQTVSNIDYILGKLEGKQESLTFIEEIEKVCKIAPVDHQDISTAIKYNNDDLEGTMQIASTIAVQSDTIVTRDPRGFVKSPILITNPFEE